MVNTGRPRFYGAFEGVFRRRPSQQGVLRPDGDAQLTSKQSGFIRWAWQKAEFACEGAAAARPAQGNTLIPRDALVVGHTGCSGRGSSTRPASTCSEADHVSGAERRPFYKTLDFATERFTGGTPDVASSRASRGATTSSFITGQTIREWRDDFSISASSHSIKFGADLQNTVLNEDAQGNPGGTWNFVNDQFFDPTSDATLSTLRGPVSVFTASLSGPHQATAAPLLPVLRAGRVEGGRGITLNLGLRYELDTLIWNENRKNDGSFYPRILPLSTSRTAATTNNVVAAPRLAWDVRNNGRTVVRAGYGRLFNTIMNGTPGAEETTLRQTAISINNATYPDPHGGRSPASFALDGAAEHRHRR